MHPQSIPITHTPSQSSHQPPHSLIPPPSRSNLSRGASPSNMSSLLAPMSTLTPLPANSLNSPTSPSGWGWGQPQASPNQRTKRPHSLPALDEGTTDTTDAQGQGLGQATAQEQGLGPGLGQGSLAMMSDEDRRNLFDNSLVLGQSTTTPTTHLHGPATKGDKKNKGMGTTYGGKNTSHPLAGGHGGMPAALSSSSQPSNSLTRRLEKLGFAQGVGADRCVVSHFSTLLSFTQPTTIITHS